MDRKIAIRATAGVIVCGIVVGSYFVGKHDGMVEMEAESKIEEVFTVTFDSSGGSYVASQTVDRGGKVSEPKEPTMDCECEFDGWYLGDERWSFSGYVVTEDITLTARWIDCFGLTAEGISELKRLIEFYDGEEKYSWRDVSDIQFSVAREGLFDYKIIYSNGKTRTLRLGEDYRVEEP